MLTFSGFLMKTCFVRSLATLYCHVDTNASRNAEIAVDAHVIHQLYLREWLQSCMTERGNHLLMMFLVLPQHLAYSLADAFTLGHQRNQALRCTLALVQAQLNGDSGTLRRRTGLWKNYTLPGILRTQVQLI